MDGKKVPFEEALTMTGFGTYNFRMLLLTGALVIAIAMEVSSVGYLVPASACELMTTSEQQGMMAGMPLIGILAASNVWGYLADTKGRRKMILVAMILGYIASTLSTFSPNWIAFCVLKFLSACAMAGTFGLANAYISECTPESKRSIFICTFTSIFSSSLAVMSVLAIPILPLTFSYYVPFLGIYLNSWRLLSIIYTVPSFFAAIGFIFAPESPKFLMTIGKNEEALEILRHMYMINTREDPVKFRVSSVVLNEASAATSSGFWRSVFTQTAPLFRPPLLKNTLLLSVIFITVYACVNPLTVWMPFIVDGVMKSLESGDTGLTICEMLRSSQNETLDLQQLEPNNCTLNDTAMLIVFGMFMIMSALNIIMALLVPCYGMKNMLITVLVMSGLASLVVNFSRIFVVTGILVLMANSSMLNFGLLSNFSVGLFPTYVKAMAVCLTLMIGRGSAVFAINFVKTLLTYNCEASFYYIGGVFLFGAAISTLLPGKEKKKTKLEMVAPTI